MSSNKSGSQSTAAASTGVSPIPGVTFVLDRDRKLPSTPESLRWNSPGHLFHLQSPYMRSRGSNLCPGLSYSGGTYFSITPHLSHGTAPEVIYTAMVISAVLTASAVREYSVPLLRAFLQDMVPQGEEVLGEILLEIHEEALAHHEEVADTEEITMLSYVSAFEHVTRSHGRGRFPVLINVIEELLFRGQEVDLYTEEDVKWMHRASPLTEYLSRHMHRSERGTGSYEGFTTAIYLEFEEDYWRVMEEGYLTYLEQVTRYAEDSFSHAEFILNNAILSPSMHFKKRMQEKDFDVIAAWGFTLKRGQLTKDILAQVQEKKKLPTRLHAIVSEMYGEASLGENVTRVSRESLATLADLAEEYNLEWAIAAMDWDEFPQSPPAPLGKPLGTNRGSW